MSDEQNSKETQGIEQQGKRDFMKTVGAGLGMAGLATLMGRPAMAADEAKQRYIVVATNGGNDPNRAILALLAAFTALDKGFGAVHVWLTLEGADMAHKTKAGKIISPIYKSFGTAEELINKLKAKGATFGVCPPCAEYMGADGGNKIDFVEKQGADWLMKNIAGAAVVWL
jgi:predicted peroxiredoxin